MIESAVMMTSDRLLRFQFHQSLLRTLTSFRDRELGPRLQLETLIERYEHGLCAWYARSNRTCELEHEETQCPNVWSRDTFPKSKKAKRTFTSVWNSLTTYDYEARIRHHTNRLERKMWDDVVKRVQPDGVIDAIRQIRFLVPLSEQKCQNLTVGDLLATNTSFRTDTQTSSVGFTYPWRAGPRYCESYIIRALQRVLGTWCSSSFVSQENHSNSNAQMHSQIVRKLISRFALEHRYFSDATHSICSRSRT